jgi:hypothetical protein
MPAKPTLSDALKLTVSDGAHSLTIDPNGAAQMAWECQLPFGDAVAGKSFLSGNAAYRYTTSQFDVLLAPEELLRLLRRELRPGEVRALRARYSDQDVFEFHRDFYDLSGVALQPMSELSPDPRWESAYERAAAATGLHRDQDLSAFRQAARDVGIADGLPMGVFVAWASHRWVGW